MVVRDGEGLTELEFVLGMLLELEIVKLDQVWREAQCLWAGKWRGLCAAAKVGRLTAAKAARGLK